MATRAQVEGEVAGRARVALRMAQLSDDPVGDASPRGYLNGPIRAGLSVLGVEPADPFGVADADLAGIAGSDLDTLLDVAELRTLELALVNIEDVDIRTTEVDEKLSQYAARLAKVVEQKRDALFGEDGDGGTASVEAPEAGVIALGFVERGDDGGEFG